MIGSVGVAGLLAATEAEVSRTRTDDVHATAVAVDGALAVGTEPVDHARLRVIGRLRVIALALRENR